MKDKKTSKTNKMTKVHKMKTKNLNIKSNSKQYSI